MKPKFSHPLAHILLAMSLLFATSCSASPTIAVSPTIAPPMETPHPVVLPSPQATDTPALTLTPRPTFTASPAVENEIVASILDSLRENYAVYDAYYKKTSPSEYTPETWLIVWAQAKKGVDPQHALDYANPNQPIKVWLLTDGQLSEVKDEQAVIREYEQKHIEMGPSWWSYTEFSILSITEDGRNAKLFTDQLCGPTCGMAYIQTYQRNASGQWEMIDKEIAGYH
jgi:hypothetical protein